MLGQQVLKAGVKDVLGIVNIADIADIADIGTDIVDIGTDIADVVDSADIADWMLRTLRWKQVDAYKVSQGCPVTLGLPAPYRIPGQYCLTITYIGSFQLFFSLF